jgi:hypothetical protein
MKTRVLPEMFMSETKAMLSRRLVGAKVLDKSNPVAMRGDRCRCTIANRFRGIP